DGIRDRTVTGVQTCALPISAVVITLFWRFGQKHRAILFVIAMAGEIPIEQALKFAFHRTRPEAYFNYPLPTSASFPSGHALTSEIGRASCRERVYVAGVAVA